MAGGSAFAAFVTKLHDASVPLIIFRMRGAKPPLTRIAKDFSRLIARLVQGRNGVTRRLCFYVWILAGPFCFHDCTRAGILLPNKQRRAG